MSIGVEFDIVVNSAPASFTMFNISALGSLAKFAQLEPFFHMLHGVKFTAFMTAQSFICMIVVLTLNSKSCIV